KKSQYREVARGVVGSSGVGNAEGVIAVAIDDSGIGVHLIGDAREIVVSAKQRDVDIKIVTVARIGNLAEIITSPGKDLRGVRCNAVQLSVVRAEQSREICTQCAVVNRATADDSCRIVPRPRVEVENCSVGVRQLRAAVTERPQKAAIAIANP